MFHKAWQNVVLIASVSLCLGSPALAQQPPPDDPLKGCNGAEAVDESGWTVPGLDGAKLKGRGPFTNLPGVFVSLLEPASAQTFFKRVWCSENHPGMIETSEMPIRVMQLWSFDIDGHVFAYRVQFAQQVIDDGARHELGAAFTVFYYDVTGSGRFTIIATHLDLKSEYIPTFIPDWAKKSASP
jgi:hypothetical protein